MIKIRTRLQLVCSCFLLRIQARLTQYYIMFITVSEHVGFELYCTINVDFPGCKEVFYNIADLNNYPNFKGKHQCKSIYFDLFNLF